MRPPRVSLSSEGHLCEEEVRAATSEPWKVASEKPMCCWHLELSLTPVTGSVSVVWWLNVKCPHWLMCLHPVFSS